MKLILAVFILWATYKTSLHKFILPDDFLGFLPMYGNIPLTNIWIWEFMNLLIVFYVAYFILMTRKQDLYYRNGFMRKNTTYLVGGKPWNWKTRFMTRFMRDAKNEIWNIMIMSNWYNNYTDVFYSSKKDFINLQKEIYLLALHTNFSIDEKMEIEKAFGWYFNFDEETRKFKPLIQKIKKLWIKVHNVTGGDEFHQYFHSRMAMSNFAKEEGQDLLGMMHQTRHSKQTLLLASQDTDALDLDFRQIADLEIEVKEWLFGFFYGFNLYSYLSTKFQNLDKSRTFKKQTKFPFWNLNKFLLYWYFERINYIFDVSQDKLFKFLNKHWNKNIYEKKKFDNPFMDWKLLYNTNFNVDKSISVYIPGTYLKKVLEKFDK